MLNFSELEKKLNIIFKDKDLLKEALTHRSFLNERSSASLRHNERLEFLGDAVLELIVTEFLFEKFPQKPEGELTAFRAALVNSGVLYEASEKIGLEDYLRLSKGESRDKGKGRHFILANAFEALIGAIYLDQGWEVAGHFINRYICSNLQRVLEEKLWRDAKSLFQEKAQEKVNITPTYEVLDEKGPDHKKTFMVGIFLGGELIASGKGFSKQEAETEAAEKALGVKNWNE